MRTLLILLSLGLLSLGLLIGCSEPAPATYPISDETCGPNDPVQGMSPIDCVPTAL